MFGRNASGIAAALAAAAISLGCASGVYRIPAAEGKAGEELAVLELGDLSMRDVTVGAIDGKSRPWGLIDRYEITPGRHVITVRLIKGGATVNSEPYDIEFTAERGKSYVLLGSAISTGPYGGKWRAWIVNKENRQTVSVPLGG